LDTIKKTTTRNTSSHSKNNSIIEDHLNKKYDKYSKYSGYEAYSKTEKRDYYREKDYENIEDEENKYFKEKKDHYKMKYPNNDFNNDNDYGAIYKNILPKDNFYGEQIKNDNNSENIDDYSKSQKYSEKYNKNSYENPERIIPKNNNIEYSDNYSSQNRNMIKNNNIVDTKDFYYENSANMMGYSSVKLKEVSNNDEKIKIIDNKIENKFNPNLNINNDNLTSKSPNRIIDENSINNDFKMLDKLKSKIKDLENKIGEINNGIYI